MRRLRIEQGLTQEQLASRAGMYFTTVGKVERGVRDPTVRTIEAFANGLGVPVAVLFSVPPEQD